MVCATASSLISGASVVVYHDNSTNHNYLTIGVNERLAACATRAEVGQKHKRAEAITYSRETLQLHLLNVDKKLEICYYENFNGNAFLACSSKCTTLCLTSPFLRAALCGRHLQGLRAMRRQLCYSQAHQHQTSRHLIPLANPFVFQTFAVRP